MIRTHEQRGARGGASERSDRAAQSGAERASLWIPSVVGGLTALLALAGPAWAPETAVHGLAVATFCASAVGFVVLLDDAARLRDADAGWRPSPWPFVAAGAVVAGALLVTVVPRPAGPAPGYYGGVALVATFLSPAVVGPVYLAIRARRVGAPDR